MSYTPACIEGDLSKQCIIVILKLSVIQRNELMKTEKGGLVSGSGCNRLRKMVFSTTHTKHYINENSIQSMIKNGHCVILKEGFQCKNLQKETSVYFFVKGFHF